MRAQVGRESAPTKDQFGPFESIVEHRARFFGDSTFCQQFVITRNRLVKHRLTYRFHFPDITTLKEGLEYHTRKEPVSCSRGAVKAQGVGVRVWGVDRSAVFLFKIITSNTSPT